MKYIIKQGFFGKHDIYKQLKNGKWVKCYTLDDYLGAIGALAKEAMYYATKEQTN